MRLTFSVQSEYINRLFDIYTKSDLSSLKLETDQTFKPLDASSPDAQKKTCTLFGVAVSSYSRTVQLPIASYDSFLGELVSAALSSLCEVQVTALAQLHGSIVNKWADGRFYSINDVETCRRCMANVPDVDAARSSYVESLVFKLVPVAEGNEAALTVLLWVNFFDSIFYFKVTDIMHF